MNAVRLLATLSLALALGGCAHLAGKTDTTTSVVLHEPLPGLYTAGQPAASDWQAIRARGVTTVVNLRLPQELAGRDEAAEVAAAGMRYVVIPVAVEGGINPDNARRLHELLAPGHGGGVLVHCASSNRAGALLALEQADYDQLTPQAALELGQRAGVTKLEGQLREQLGIAH